MCLIIQNIIPSSTEGVRLTGRCVNRCRQWENMSVCPVHILSDDTLTRSLVYIWGHDTMYFHRQQLQIQNYLNQVSRAVSHPHNSIIHAWALQVFSNPCFGPLLYVNYANVTVYKICSSGVALSYRWHRDCQVLSCYLTHQYC